MHSGAPRVWLRFARRALAVALVAAGCDSPTKPVAVASVSIRPSSSTVLVGTPVALTATLSDSKGNVLTGRAISWVSASPSVASVSSSGLVTTLAAGAATITATSEGASGNTIVTVLPIPIASVSVALSSTTVTIGTTQQATATLRDANGGTLTGRVITWSTTTPAIVAVNASGVVTGLAAGVGTVIANSEGISGSATVNVPGAAPVIANIAPATLTPGSNATITGSGFDTSLGGVSVTIGGVPAPIASASATQLVVSVPCVLSGNVDVRVVNVGSAAATRSQPLTVTQRTIPLGQALILQSAAESACNQLAPTGGAAKYLVTVFSDATSPNTTSAFELAGNPVAAGAAAALQTRALTSARSVQNVNSDDAARLRQERAHFDHLERTRRDYAELISASRRVGASTASTRRESSLRAAAADVSVGDMRTLYFTFTGGCQDTTRVMRVKALRVGTKSIVWEDSANVLQSANDAALAGFYQRLGQTFDNEQYFSVKKAFGDPLLRDAALDNDGKVSMVFTDRVNGSGAAAFVTSCDMFASSVSRGSNFGEYFYGSTPVSSGSNLESVNFPDGWFNFMGRTVVHEVKHVASLGARIALNAASFEQSWLEEGTARHAEEIWTRDYVHHELWRGNSGYGSASTNGVFCDFNASDATCLANDPVHRPTYGVRRQFNEIRPKLLSPWDWSPFGDASSQGSTGNFYQTTWSLVRYASDRYATNDTAFLRALINTTAVGTANLTAVAGVSLDQLLGGWGLALYADDYPGLVNPSPDIQFATWNLRSIYAGLNATPAWSARWNTAFPIAPLALTPGSFVAQVPSIRGGAHAYFELSGSFTTPQLLNVRANATTPLASNLRIAIARLQ